MRKERSHSSTGTHTVKATDEVLNSIYFDVNNPASYSSLEKLYRAAKENNKGITFSDVKDWAKSNLNILCITQPVDTLSAIELLSKVCMTKPKMI